MKHLDPELEKLEQRVAPGLIVGVGGTVGIGVGVGVGVGGGETENETCGSNECDG